LRGFGISALIQAALGRFVKAGSRLIVVQYRDVRELVVEVLRFTRSILPRIFAYITGGAIAAMAFLTERFSGTAIPWHVVLFGLVAFFIVASFLTWRDEYHRANALEERRKRAAANRLEHLGQFSLRGQALADRLSQCSVARPEPQDLIRDVKDWAHEVESYLRADPLLRTAYVARFSEHAAFPTPPIASGFRSSGITMRTL